MTARRYFLTAADRDRYERRSRAAYLSRRWRFQNSPLRSLVTEPGVLGAIRMKKNFMKYGRRKTIRHKRMSRRIESAKTRLQRRIMYRKFERVRLENRNKRPHFWYGDY